MKDKKKYIAPLIYASYIFYIIGLVSDDVFPFLADYLSYVIFALLFGIFLISKKEYKVRDITLMGIFLVLFLFSLLQSISGLGSYLNLLNAFLILFIMGNARFSKGVYRTMSITSVVLFTLFFSKSFVVWNEFTDGDALMNPNTIAQSLVLCTCPLYMSVTRLVRSKAARNIIQLAVLGMAFSGALMCNSRTAILAIAVISVCLKIKFIKWIILKTYKIMCLLIIALGVATPFVYIDMHNDKVKTEVPFIDGKEFYTGRERIWKYGIDDLSFYNGYAWGLGTHHSTDIGEITNFHNWYVGDIFYFGAVISVVFFLFTIYRLSELKNEEMKVFSLAVFIFGIFEMSIQWEFSQILFMLSALFEGTRGPERMLAV